MLNSILLCSLIANGMHPEIKSGVAEPSDFVLKHSLVLDIKNIVVVNNPGKEKRLPRNGTSISEGLEIGTRTQHPTTVGLLGRGTNTSYIQSNVCRHMLNLNSKSRCFPIVLREELHPIRCNQDTLNSDVGSQLFLSRYVAGSIQTIRDIRGSRSADSSNYSADCRKKLNACGVTTIFAAAYCTWMVLCLLALVITNLITESTGFVRRSVYRPGFVRGRLYLLVRWLQSNGMICANIAALLFIGTFACMFYSIYLCVR